VIDVGTALVNFIKQFYNRMLLISKELASIEGVVNEKWFIAVVMTHKPKRNL